MTGGPPELSAFEMSLWANNDELHEKVAFPNGTRVVSYPDYLVLGAPSQRSCYSYDEANFTCQVQCDSKAGCGAGAYSTLLPWRC